MYPVIDTKSTSKRIKFLMQLKGYTAKDIQEYLNLACVQSVYHWLDGTCLPSIDNLYALSGLFHVPMDAMICGSKTEKSNQDSSGRVLLYCSQLKDIMAA